MADQRVVSYIREQLSKGFPRSQIGQALLSQGWQRRDVDEAMNEATLGHEGSMAGGANSGAKKNVPGLIKAIAVLTYIGAGLIAIAGIMLLVGGSFLGALIGLLSASAGSLGTIIFVIAGVVSLGLAVLDVFVGIGLWKGMNWARIVSIIFAILGILGGAYYIAIASYFSGVLGIIVGGLIGGYLLFSKRVKEAFAK